MILDDDLSIVWGLFLSGTPKDLESIASIVLKFFDQHERELYLMKQAITKEVQLTSALRLVFVSRCSKYYLHHQTHQQHSSDKITLRVNFFLATANVLDSRTSKLYYMIL